MGSRSDYNEHRPHTSLRGLTPNEFATRDLSLTGTPVLTASDLYPKAQQFQKCLAENCQV